MNPNKNKNIDEKYNGSCLFNYLFIKCQTILKNGSCFIISHFMPIYQSFKGFQSRELNDFVITLQISPGGHMGH